MLRSNFYIYRALTIVAFLLCHVFLSAQREEVANLFFENMTVDDKLPFDKFNSGLIDSDGFLWLSSVHGIVRYDGYEFKVFRNAIGEEDAMVEGRIAEIVLDKNDDMWIGGTRGLSRMNIKTGALLNLGKSPDKYPILGKHRGNMLVDTIGNVWILTELGINCVHVDDLSIRSWGLRKHMDIPVDSWSTGFNMSFDKQDSNIIWIGSQNGLLKFNIEKGDYDVYHTPQYLENVKEFDFVHDVITYVYADASGLIYTGRNGGSSGEMPNLGMQIFNSSNHTWEVFHFPKTHTESQRMCYLSNKSEKELWIGCPSRGLGVFNKQTKEIYFTQHESSNPNTLKDNNIRFCLEDTQGNLVVATISALSISYKQHQLFKFNKLFHADLKDFKKKILITGVLETDRYKVVTSIYAGGLILIDKFSEKEEIIPLSRKIESDQQKIYKGMEDHNGLVYLATISGLYVFDPATKKIKEFVSPSGERLQMESRRMYDIVEDKKNRLWIGTSIDGLIEISPDRNSITYHTHDENDPNSLSSMGVIKSISIDPHDRVWITTFAGVSCYTPKEKKFVNYSERETGDQQLITKYTHTSLTDTLGRQWISSYVLFCIDESKPRGMQQEIITVKNGLPGSLIRRMKLHPDGTIWMITDNGLVNFNPYDHSMKVYTTKEGLFRNQMWDEAFYITLDGKVRVFGNNGYVEFQKEKEEQIKLPAVAITNFETNRTSYEKMLNYNSTDTIRLDYTENFFAVKYAALNYSPRADNSYAYMLSGYDDHWINVGQRRYAEYTDVDGGYYTFKVKATDRFGNISEKKVEKVIFIATPYWKTWWFRILLGLCVIGLVGLLIGVRLATIRREKNLRMQLAENEMIALRAQMNPHFLFNTINSIKRFIIKNETVAAADHLTKFSRLVRLILNNSNSKSIALSDEIEALRLYIGMEMMRFDDKFETQINIDPSLNVDEIEVPPMLIQPFVENAIWHGLMHKSDGVGVLRIDLFQVDNYLVCSVVDNGIGRRKAAEIKSKTATKKKSLGMSLTERRIKLLDQFSDKDLMHLEIIDLLDDKGEANGTKVLIRIPIDYKDIN